MQAPPPGRLSFAPSSSTASIYPDLSRSYQQPPPPPQQQQLAPPSTPGVAPPSSQQQPVLAPVRPEDPVYGPLERASKLITEQLVKDQNLIGELGEGLQGSSSQSYTPLPISSNFSPFVNTKITTFPDGLFGEIQDQNTSMLMGIFPELDLAWITVDNKLFFWEYKKPGADYIRYDGQTEQILNVALVPAKPSVFISEITHLLIISTQTTLVLLGLPSSASEFMLYPTGFSVSTDGITMRDVVGMPNGLTFMYGNDGDIYELIYAAKDGWFSNKCQVSNLTGAVGASLGVLAGLVPEFLKSNTEDPVESLTLDSTRSVLYSLTRSNSIVLYIVGGSSSLVQVAKLVDISRKAQMLVPGHPMLDSKSFKIKSLSAIGTGEGERGAQMVAVTAQGVRLYFSYYRRDYGGFRTTGGPPRGLELVHIRFPPTHLVGDAPPPTPYSNNANGYPYQVQPPPPAPSIRFHSLQDNALCSGGVFIGAQYERDNLDVLLLTCPDLGQASQASSSSNTPSSNPQPNQPFNSVQQQQQYYNSAPSSSLVTTSTTTTTSRPPLIEQALVLPVSGHMRAIAEIPHVLTSLPAPESLRVPGRGALRLNELAAQTSVQPRRFLVLTTHGMYEIRKQRPVDVLKAVLESGAGLDGGVEVPAFFDTYGRDQSCAMCLAVASESSSPSTPVSSDAISTATRWLYMLGEKPIKVERGYGHGVAGAGQSGTRIDFSGKHEGLAIYFSRLVRPIWNQKITKSSPIPTNPSRQISNLPDQTLKSVLRDLSSLKNFIERNSQLFTTGPGSEYSSISNSNDRSNDQEAWRAEQESLNSIVSLVTQAIEALSFVLVLVDHKLPETIASCSPEIQTGFGSLTYQQLFTTKTGRDTARNVVNAIIHQQIGQQNDIEAISSTLQQRCGSFCRAADVILFKAIEALKNAGETRDPSSRRDYLRESLRLFAKGTSNLSLEKLQRTCAEYRSLHFSTGAIELPLKCAQDWDPEGQAFGYLADGERPNDPRRAAFESRQRCYECVFETLLAFDEMLENSGSGGFTSSGEDIDTLRDAAYAQATSSEDPLFHTALYDWMISRQMADQVLEMQTPFIESYLAKEPLSHPRANLLWQFYARSGNSAQAALVQAHLAQTLELPLLLAERVEYLTLAVSNAKSSGSSSRSAGPSVEFLTDLEEKLEVAQVQLEVARTVYEHVDMDQNLKDDLQAKLDSRLMNISELYLDFAEPFEMLEIILLILHTSDHRDPALVSKTWRAILERTDSEAATEADKPDAVAAIVVTLGRKFFPSETAFPLEFVCRRLEEYSHINRREARPGWVPATLRQAGAEWDRIFEVFSVIFEEKMPPWQTEAAIHFLATDIIILIRDWFAEWTRSQASFSQRPTARFPVLYIEEFITNSLLPCFVSVDENDPRLETLRGLQRAMRTKI
ncbi:Non-repetitive/WGA-negative nucleoporin C-terminal-domain-containing protein [Mrakia frigida]|uniref:Non-repetitive/WGA-negative nucleoporin C-terminal-domain-containing protein n=1 Tax=Mrakia frigida TaxID=29902 RepID=UPI003FCC1FD4